MILCTIRAVTQGSNYARLLSLEACADNTLTRIVGNTSHYYRAYLCEIENTSRHSCSCVNSELECLSYYSPDTATCANLIESLPGLVYTSYFLSILCGVLSLMLSVMGLASWRFYKAMNLQQGPGQRLMEDHGGLGGEDDDEDGGFYPQILVINLLTALSATAGAYYILSSGIAEQVDELFDWFLF
jgi:hypothetical protein